MHIIGSTLTPFEIFVALVLAFILIILLSILASILIPIFEKWDDWVCNHFDQGDRDGRS